MPAYCWAIFVVLVAALAYLLISILWLVVSLVVVGVARMIDRWEEKKWRDKLKR